MYGIVIYIFKIILLLTNFAKRSNDNTGFFLISKNIAGSQPKLSDNFKKICIDNYIFI